MITSLQIFWFISEAENLQPLFKAILFERFCSFSGIHKSFVIATYKFKLIRHFLSLSHTFSYCLVYIWPEKIPSVKLHICYFSYFVERDSLVYCRYFWRCIQNMELAEGIYTADPPQFCCRLIWFHSPSPARV
jgi:hypothetical protein